MVTKEFIEEFFEEQFQNTSQFFLYKDKKLLKNEKYREFAEEQVKKANKTFWSAAFACFVGVFYATISLVEYGANTNWFDLILGLSALIVLIVTLLHSAKEYYTIKSSMSFFIKLLDNQKTTPAT